jgi:lactate permease
MDFIVTIAPIVILIYLMTKKNSVPSHVALPAVALLMYGIKLIYFAAAPDLVHASVLDGLLSAWTPILIIWGAIFLFKTMEHSGAMDVIRSWLTEISGNRVAQLMIIGWAFAFLIEGASGFGTPPALAAPLLVGLGFAPLKVAIFCLMTNTVPVSFGAVGTPTWFGFGALQLENSQILKISFDSAFMHACAALVIPLIALNFVVTWQEIKANLIFIYLSILSCVIPFVALAKFNYEFPAIVGGMIGLVISVILAQKGIGLVPESNQQIRHSRVSNKQLFKALFPLWATVIILLVTRIPELGLKGILNSETPALKLVLGSLADMSISAALVIRLEHIFGTTTSWVFQTLYIPALIPFFLISFISFSLFGLKKEVAKQVAVESYQRIQKPMLALLGALVMVKLLMAGGERAPVIIIGNTFADAVGQYWQYFTAYLGALGSFFSGSATISNLTFGGIQNSIAQNLMLDITVILSLQSVGAAMGNMVCINNIVAVCSVLGIEKKEGDILKRTFLPTIVYGIIAVIAGLLL